MSARPATSPARRFLRGLVNTALWLLLPCQLALLWVVTRDDPLELPGPVARLLEEAAADAGLRLHARRYLLTPQRTVVAEDVAVEIAGLTGEVFTADRAEVGLRLTGAQRGLASLRLIDGRLWCPAAAAARGERTLLLERLHCRLAREGRWWQARILARAGRLTLDFEGTLPAAVGSGPEAGGAATRPPAETFAATLRQLETALGWTTRGGGGALTLVGAGRADGGVDITGDGLFGDDWSDERLGLVRLSEPRLAARLRLEADGRPGPWRVQLAARNLDLQGRTAALAAVTLEGEGTAVARCRGAAQLLGAQAFGLADMDVWLRGSGGPGASWSARARTATSHLEATWTPRGGESTFRATTATLSFEDLRRLPGFREAGERLGLGLEGRILLADLEIRCAGADWRVLAAEGRAAFGGLQALGIGAETIAPGRSASLAAAFRYDPTAREFPLVLRELDLAGVRGEASCSLEKGGPYRLNLRGELAPASLDKLLGDWWVGLWRLFRITRRPSAVIEVEGAWGRPETTTTRGAVLLQGFTFLEAPFRSVEVRVDADARRTWIGLRRLAGGASPEDGEVDGTATWDWSQPLAAAGPVVQVTGNLRPWIAATVAGRELGEALRPLDLPPTRRLEVMVTPGATGRPEVAARVRCAEPFQAWQVPSGHLDLSVRSTAEGLAVGADLDLADGRAHLDLRGELLRTPLIELRLSGCDFAKVGALVGQLNGTAPAPTPPGRTSVGRLDLGFKGRIDLEHPTRLRGKGDFTLVDPELKKVRVLGGLSSALEAIGVEATSYELRTARGTFGCLEGRAYFPDLVLSGADSQLKLAGEVDLSGPTVNFAGDFSLPSKGSWNPLQILNLNRMLVAMTKVRVRGPLGNPTTSALPRLKDLVNSNDFKDLGKIPPSLSE